MKKNYKKGLALTMAAGLTLSPVTKAFAAPAEKAPVDEQKTEENKQETKVQVDPVNSEDLKKQTDKELENTKQANMRKQAEIDLALKEKEPDQKKAEKAVEESKAAYDKAAAAKDQGAKDIQAKKDALTDTVNKEKTAAEEALKATETSIQAKTDEKAQLEAAIAESDKKIESLNKEIADLEAQKKDPAELEAAKQQAETELEAAKAEQKKVNDEIDKNRAEIEKINGQIKTQQDKKKTAEAELTQLNAALEEKEQAKADAEKKAVDNKTAVDALNQNIKEIDQDITKLQNSKNDQDKIIKESQDKIKGYQAQIKTAEGELATLEENLKNIDVAGKQKALDDAKALNADVDKQIAEKQKALEEAQKKPVDTSKIQQEISNLNTEKTTLTQEKNDAVKAKEDLTKANQALEDQIKNLDTTPLGFVKSLLAEAKGEAGAKAFFDEALAKSRTHANGGQTDLNDPTSAIQFSNLDLCIKGIEKCNELRAGHGAAALRISPELMIYAALQADWSSNTWGHSQMFDKIGENLAGAGIGLETEADINRAFNGWYTREKGEYDNYIKQGLTPEQIEQQHFGKVGHYLNIINPSYNVTGFAGSRKVKADTGSWVAISETFSFTSNGFSSMTVEEFKTKLLQWNAKADTLQKQIDDNNAAIAEKQTLIDAKDAAIAAKDAAIADAEQRKTEAEANKTEVDKLTKEIDALTKSKKPTSALENALKQAKEDQAKAQKAVDDKKAEKENLQGQITREEEIINGLSDIDGAIKAKQDEKTQKQQELKTKQDAQAGLDSKKDESIAAVTKAQADVTAKEKEIQACDAEITKLENSKVGESTLADLEKQLAAADQAVETKTAKVQEAADALTAADQIVKDLEAKKVEAADETKAKETAIADVHAISAELATLEGKKADDQKKVDAAAEKADALASWMDGKNPELNGIKEFEEEIKVIETAAASQKLLEKAVETAKKDLDDDSAVLAQVVKEMDDLKAQKAVAADNVAKADAEIAARKGEVDPGQKPVTPTVQPTTQPTVKPIVQPTSQPVKPGVPQYNKPSGNRGGAVHTGDVQNVFGPGMGMLAGLAAMVGLKKRNKKQK